VVPRQCAHQQVKRRGAPRDDQRGLHTGTPCGRTTLQTSWGQRPDALKHLGSPDMAYTGVREQAFDGGHRVTRDRRCGDLA
jgi:hypothetical protein